LLKLKKIKISDCLFVFCTKTELERFNYFALIRFLIATVVISHGIHPKHMGNNYRLHNIRQAQVFVA